MTSADALRARETLGLTRDQLAFETHHTPSVVEAWEEGRIRVPKHIATDLAWRMAARERQKVLEASGLPACDWIRELEGRAAPADVSDQAERIECLLIHARACELCAAREAYVAERCPPMPPAPGHGPLAMITPIRRRIRALPEWAQVPVTIAIFCVAYALVELMVVLPSSTDRSASAVLKLVEAPLGGGLLAIAIGSPYTAWRRRRDARMPPERRTALEHLERRMDELRAYGLYEDATHDSYLRQRQAIRRGEVVIGEL